jgi:uncharacterized protein YjdB
MRKSFLIGAVAFVAMACGADRALQTNPPVDSLITCLLVVAVSPASVTLHPGDTLRLQVTGGAGCTPFTEWRWRSSDTLVASVDSIGGLVRARSRGVATAIAEAVSDRNVKGAAAITVVP